MRFSFLWWSKVTNRYSFLPCLPYLGQTANFPWSQNQYVSVEGWRSSGISDGRIHLFLSRLLPFSQGWQRKKWGPFRPLAKISLLQKIIYSVPVSPLWTLKKGLPVFSFMCVSLCVHDCVCLCANACWVKKMVL